MLVPASSSGRLFHEYGDIQKVAFNNENSSGPYQPGNNTLRASSADYSSNPGSLTFPNGNYLPFPHLLNFFQASKGLTVSGGTATYSTSVAPNFSRLLDLLSMPGPFMGAEQWYNPTNFSEANNSAMATGYRPPFNYLPNFREAGRLNLNTLGDYDSNTFPYSPVWDALTANLPYDSATSTGSPKFNIFNQKLDGARESRIHLN